jgi:hypothetical protein
MTSALTTFGKVSAKVRSDRDLESRIHAFYALSDPDQAPCP